MPWPHRDLSPNSRVHWHRKANKAKKHRKAACVLTQAADGPLKGYGCSLAGKTGKLSLSLQFVPPANRRYDLDNLISRMKSSFDGIADGLGVDDHQFTFSKIELGQAQKGGKVIVCIETMESASV